MQQRPPDHDADAVTRYGLGLGQFVIFYYFIYFIVNIY